jgi:hypothetical protein
LIINQGAQERDATPTNSAGNAVAVDSRGDVPAAAPPEHGTDDIAAAKHAAMRNQLNRPFGTEWKELA